MVLNLFNEINTEGSCMIQSDQHKIVKLKPQKLQQGKYHLRQDCFQMKDSNFKTKGFC